MLLTLTEGEERVILSDWDRGECIVKGYPFPG